MTTILVVMAWSLNGLAVPLYARSFEYPNQTKCNEAKREVLLGGKKVSAHCVPLVNPEEWTGLGSGKIEKKKVTKKEKEKNRG